MHDLERLVARISLGTAGPRDLVVARPVARRCCRACARSRRRCRRRSSRSLVGEVDDLADVRDAIDRHARRRAAGARARRRRDSRRRRRRARRAARDQPRRQGRDRRDGRGRARAHRHRVAEDSLQPRLRVLHRDLEVEPRRGAGRLHPQADDRRRRALHHAGAQGVRGQGARRRRAHRRARARALRGAARARSPPRRRAFSTPRAPWRRSTCWPRWPTRPPPRNYTKPFMHDGDEFRPPTRAIRSSSATSPSAFVPNDVHLDRATRAARDPHRARTWAASPRTCGRSRCSRCMAQAGSFVPARSAKLAHRRSHLRARRRVRQHRARAVDVHGRDAGDGDHSAHGHHSQPGDPRRDRPRHRDVRRPEPGVGGRRASRVESRARGRRRSSRRTITSSPISPTRCRASSTSTSPRASSRTRSSSCTRSSPADPIAATASRSRGSPACRRRSCARAAEILHVARAGRAAARRPAEPERRAARQISSSSASSRPRPTPSGRRPPPRSSTSIA